MYVVVYFNLAVGSIFTYLLTYLLIAYTYKKYKHAILKYTYKTKIR